MQLRMWTYDYAREQSPSLDHLRRLCALSLESGYNALGLYLEHRLAYPSVPWARGQGALSAEDVGVLEREFPELQIMPFVNLLGHVEGLLYTEEGKRYAEQRFGGMQACPSQPAFVELAEKMLGDAMAIFSSEMIHIGGDETWQLGQCPACEERVKRDEAEGRDGKACLYGRHFGPLAQRVVDAGRVPAVWGDMLLDHPQALDFMPAETVIFNWQYFEGPLATSRKLGTQRAQVFCPSIQTYNAVWMHLEKSEANVREHAVAAELAHALGVCVTTWECGLFGDYETLLPAIQASGLMLENPEASFLEAYRAKSTEHAEWARLMGVELERLQGMFAHSGRRSSLKCRLLASGNPFLAWLHHGEELSGQTGAAALEIVGRALAVAPDSSTRGVAQFAKSAIEFVRFAEQARQAYAQGLPGVAVSCLAPARQIFDDLSKIAKATFLNTGGSRADIERCAIARVAVERAILRIKEYGDGSLGYLPAFEVITHPSFVPHDQGALWIPNDWATR